MLSQTSVLMITVTNLCVVMVLISTVSDSAVLIEGTSEDVDSIVVPFWETVVVASVLVS